MSFTGTTLGEARDWLRDRVEQGEHCPCCTQFAKVYKRPLNSGMARSLIKMYQVGGLNFIRIPTSIPARSREEGKLRYWGLVLEELTERPDGGRAGWWRVTPDGERFIYQTLTVQKYAHIYDGRLMKLSGPRITIQDALGTKFDLRELMGWK